MSEAIDKLREALLDKGFRGQFPPTSISVITPEYVRVYKTFRWGTSGSGVSFEGQFAQDTAGLYLSGRFATDQSNRALLTLGISTYVTVVMLIGLIGLFDTLVSVSSSIAAPIFSLAFSVFVIFALRAITQATTERDAKWLSEKIQMALSKETAGHH